MLILISFCFFLYLFYIIGNLNGTSSATSTNATNNNPSFGLGVDDYNPSLYHPSATNAYASYSPTSLLQPSYPVGPYGVSSADQVRLYSSQLKHEFG